MWTDNGLGLGVLHLPIKIHSFSKVLLDIPMMQPMVTMIMANAHFRLGSLNSNPAVFGTWLGQSEATIKAAAVAKAEAEALWRFPLCRVVASFFSPFSADKNSKF